MKNTVKSNTGMMRRNKTNKTKEIFLKNGLKGENSEKTKRK